MHHYIVIEGPLGAGKTSFATMLAERLNGQALLEEEEDNPFLAKFYQNPKKYSFQAQLYFLLRRYHMTLDIAQIDLFKRIVVADFLFDKDRIFAHATLEDEEFWLYDQMFQILRRRVLAPDLVIFLQARTEVLAERIKRRNRKFEKGISFKYLDQINQAFNEFFFHFSGSPLLVVNASEIDFENRPEDFDDLVERIQSMKSGTQFYVPAGSG